jgi:hypothetical protein
MQPQIVGLNAGVHNAQLSKSAARIVDHGHWKKQRTVTIIPAGGMMPTKAAIALRNLMFPPNQPMHLIAALGMEVGEAYSQTIEQVLAHPDLSKWEYLLTVEHDNIPPSDGVLALMARMEQHKEFSCIGGLYWTKGVGGVPQIWGDARDPIINFRPQAPIPGQLVECCGTGMGFNLWRMKMFHDKRLPRPLFRTVAGKEGIGTQDLTFWQEARKLGYRCAIDCAVTVGHYSVEDDITW